MKHGAFQEDIAAYALHALEDHDLLAVEEEIRLHIPSCEECRRLLDSFMAVSGDLALVAGSHRPPRTLAARVRRQLEYRRHARWAVTAAVAAIVVSVVSLSAWNAHLSHRVSRAEDRQSRAAAVLTAVTHPHSQVVPLAASRQTPRTTQMAAAFVPGRESLYLFGSLPSPAGDNVYQVWLAQGDRFSSFGTFLPEEGVVLLQFAVDPQHYDALLITEEPREGSVSPSERSVVSASL